MIKGGFSLVICHLHADTDRPRAQEKLLLREINLFTCCFERLTKTQEIRSLCHCRLFVVSFRSEIAQNQLGVCALQVRFISQKVTVTGT